MARRWFWIATRRVIKYRQSLITRRVAIQNHLRAIVQREGILLDRGSRAWTKAGFEVIQQVAKPLEECSAEELWRGEAALELQALKAAARSGMQAGSVCGVERARQVVAQYPRRWTLHGGGGRGLP